jgi:uncharacterized membrane protein
MPSLTTDLKVLVSLFAGSGALHLVRPETFEPIVPKALPARRQLVYVSGVAELLCAGGLLHPRTCRLAGWASGALLVGVFPANVQMAWDARHSRRTSRKAIAFGRLPLQVPLVRAALEATRR